MTSRVSTLIEFPAAGRSAQPLWRKELSDRVREIQHRRQREAEEAALQVDQVDEEQRPLPAQTESHLGLVPPSVDPSTLNPIVAAALRRLERAQRPPPPPPRARSTGMNGASAATALARVVEEKRPERPPAAAVSTGAPEAARASLSQSLPALPEKSKSIMEPERPTNFVMVVPDRPTNSVRPSPPGQSAAAAAAGPKQPMLSVQSVQPATKPAAAAEPPATTPELSPLVLSPAPQPRRVFVETVVDDEVLSRYEATRTYNPINAIPTGAETAPISARLVGGIVDVFLIAFAASPVAAIIELMGGDWTNTGVVALVCGSVVVVSFLYLAASTALRGRTWGMSLVSLRTVDATTHEPPTIEQSVRRALAHMLSVLAFGLGLLFALLDVESRTAHDRYSGTIVVRE